MGVTICKDDLIKLGYKKYQAISLIREAKAIMVHQKGCAYYNNKRLGRGVSFESEMSGINEK